MPSKLRPWHIILGVQVIAVAFFFAYVSSQPLLPGSGLQQIDALTLHEKVSGLRAINNQPTIVIATGLLSVDKCREQAENLVNRYGHSGGIEGRFGVLVLAEQGAIKISNTTPNIRIQPDDARIIAGKLALRSATQNCQPGYAIVDPDGFVRYRTFDALYDKHSQEQNILLESLTNLMDGNMHANSSQPVGTNHEN